MDELSAAANVFAVVHPRRFEAEQRLWAMGRQPLLGKEVWVARGNDAVGREEAGTAVVGM